MHQQISGQLARKFDNVWFLTEAACSCHAANRYGQVQSIFRLHCPPYASIIPHALLYFSGSQSIRRGFSPEAYKCNVHSLQSCTQQLYTQVHTVSRLEYEQCTTVAVREHSEGQCTPMHRRSHTTGLSHASMVTTPPSKYLLRRPVTRTTSALSRLSCKLGRQARRYVTNLSIAAM